MVQTEYAGTMRVAVIIPCYNEEKAIGTVVRKFKAALPDARVYVYDNNSRDRTVEEARAAGAIVRSEPLQGKGNVVRRMFADVEADVYVMTDGATTFPGPPWAWSCSPRWSCLRILAALLAGVLVMAAGMRQNM